MVQILFYFSLLLRVYEENHRGVCFSLFLKLISHFFREFWRCTEETCTFSGTWTPLFFIFSFLLDDDGKEGGFLYFSKKLSFLPYLKHDLDLSLLLPLNYRGDYSSSLWMVNIILDVSHSHRVRRVLLQLPTLMQVPTFSFKFTGENDSSYLLQINIKIFNFILHFIPQIDNLLSISQQRKRSKLKELK